MTEQDISGGFDPETGAELGDDPEVAEIEAARAADDAEEREAPIVLDVDGKPASMTDQYLSVLWREAHRFDEEALATGKCAIGSFDAGCAHRMPNVRDTFRAVREAGL